MKTSTTSSGKQTPFYKKSAQSSQADQDDKWNHSMYSQILRENKQQQELKQANDTYSNSQKDDQQQYSSHTSSHYNKDNSGYNQHYSYQGGGYGRGYNKYKNGSRAGDEVSSQSTFNMNNNSNGKRGPVPPANGKKKYGQNEGGYKNNGNTESSYNHDKSNGNWNRDKPNYYPNSNYNKNTYNYNQQDGDGAASLSQRSNFKQSQNQYYNNPQQPQQQEVAGSKKKPFNQNGFPPSAQSKKEKETIPVILEQEIDKSQFQLGFFRKDDDIETKDEQYSEDPNMQHRKIHYNNHKEEKEHKSQMILSVNVKMQGYDLKIDIREDDNVKEIIDKTTSALKLQAELQDALEIYIVRKLEEMGKINQTKPIPEQTKPIQAPPQMTYDNQPQYGNMNTRSNNYHISNDTAKLLPLMEQTFKGQGIPITIENNSLNSTQNVNFIQQTGPMLITPNLQYGFPQFMFGPEAMFQNQGNGGLYNQHNNGYNQQQMPQMQQNNKGFQFQKMWDQGDNYDSYNGGSGPNNNSNNNTYNHKYQTINQGQDFR